MSVIHKQMILWPSLLVEVLLKTLVWNLDNVLFTVDEYVILASGWRGRRELIYQQFNFEAVYCKKIATAQMMRPWGD